MIKKINSRIDHEQVFSFLKEEVAMNLFIIGDIEAFGYDTDFSRVMGSIRREAEH